MNISRILKIVNIIYIVFVAYEYYCTISTRNNKRRWWVREMNLSRDQHGFFNRSFLEMKSIDIEHFEKATRFNVKSFELLLNLLKARLTKHSHRQPIDAECRLAVTLM